MFQLAGDGLVLLFKYCDGRSVVDLGAGNCQYAHVLELSGLCKSVLAVDGEFPNVERGQYCAQVENRIELSFEEYLESEPTLDTVLLMWPPQYACQGLLGLLQRSRRIIYWGSNCDCAAAGPADVWRWLVTRKVAEYWCEHPKADAFIVYENEAEERRPLGEELGALDRSRMYGREEAERLALGNIVDGGLQVRRAASLLDGSSLIYEGLSVAECPFIYADRRNGWVTFDSGTWTVRLAGDVLVMNVRENLWIPLGAIR